MLRVEECLFDRVRGEGAPTVPFTADHQGFWDRAPARLGDGTGTRALIEVLLHRRMPAAPVTAGIRAALEAGSCTPDAVAIEARKHAVSTADAAGRPWRALQRPRPPRAAVVTPATVRATAARRPAPGSVGGRLRRAARPARRQ